MKIMVLALVSSLFLSGCATTHTHISVYGSRSYIIHPYN